MSEKPLNVLICGAGVAGASMALTLAKQPGLKLQPNITLIERSPVPRRTGQAVDIRGPGVDVIAKIGLEPEIKARHTTETGLALLNGSGGVVAHMPSTGDSKAQSATSEYEILRGDLTGLLLDGLDEAKERGVQLNVVYGETIQSLDDRADGSGVDVIFSNGKVANQRFDLVVGADGIGSKTRAMIFGKEDKPEFVKPSGLYLGFFTVPRIPGDDLLWRWATFAPGLAIHLRPHNNGKTMGVYLSICNSTPSRNPELESVIHSDVATQKAYLRQRFEKSGCTWQLDRFLAGLDAADDFYMTHWCHVRTDRWAKGRCVILGDAAFATMGIGTSLAMTGAYLIAGELSKIGSPADVPSALQSYESIFRPFVLKTAINFPQLMQLMNPQSRLGCWLVHGFFRVLSFLRIPSIVMKLMPGEKEGWTVPEYGW